MLRTEFPVLESASDKPLAFLDNAATTQKPRCVINAVNEYYGKYYSSVKRGAYKLSANTTNLFEQTRAKVAKFLDAESENSMVFTRGTTESINLVAWSYGLANFSEGDEILVSNLEHHANIVPWQIVGKEKKTKLRVIPCSDSGDLLISELPNLLNDRTKIVALTHTANSIGTINPLEQIIRVIHKHAPKAKILIDAAQAIAHSKVSVRELDCDFLAFSGHKIYAPTGIGVLFGKAEILGTMPPWHGGGEMIEEVSFEKTTFAQPPARFEAGTPPIAGVLGLSAALDFVNGTGLEKIAEHEKQITDYAIESLQKIDNLEIIGTPQNRGAIVSFIIKGIHPHDIAMILDEESIAIRAGHHCAQPVMTRFGIPATARVSFAVYTESWEIDRLVEALKRVVRIFG